MSTKPQPDAKPKPQRIRVNFKGQANTKGTGKPSKLDAKLANQIVGLLQRGITMEIACQATGIHTATAYHWIEKGKKEVAGHPYREFSDAIGKARALCEISLVEIIQKHAPENADDAKWLLERMFPARYGKQVALAIAGADGGAVQIEHKGDQPIPLNLPAIFALPRTIDVEAETVPNRKTA